MKTIADEMKPRIESAMPTVAERAKRARQRIHDICDPTKKYLKRCIPVEADDFDVLLLYIVDEYERLNETQG